MFVTGEHTMIYLLELEVSPNLAQFSPYKNGIKNHKFNILEASTIYNLFFSEISAFIYPVQENNCLIFGQLKKSFI